MHKGEEEAYAAFVGIDWADKKHDICLSVAGQVLWSGDGQMVDWGAISQLKSHLENRGFGAKAQRSSHAGDPKTQRLIKLEYAEMGFCHPERDPRLSRGAQERERADDECVYPASAET